MPGRARPCSPTWSTPASTLVYRGHETLRDYEAKDQVLAGQGAVVLWSSAHVAGRLRVAGAWSVAVVHGFAGPCGSGQARCSPSGSPTPGARAPTIVDVLARPQAWSWWPADRLPPHLYGAFNRRETKVTLLTARAGRWHGAAARTRYGVAGAQRRPPAFYNRWERWAADVAESHSNYPVLVRFRSPQALSSWLVGLLAVMDSAAMLLSCAQPGPHRAPAGHTHGVHGLRADRHRAGHGRRPRPRP